VAIYMSDSIVTLEQNRAIFTTPLAGSLHLAQSQ